MGVVTAFVFAGAAYAAEPPPEPAPDPAAVAPAVPAAVAPADPAAADPAAADPTPSLATLPRAFLTLVLDGVEHDPIAVYIADHDAFVAVADLTAAGLTVNGGTIVGDGAPFVSLASLAGQLTWHIDEAALRLTIDADATGLAGTRLDLRTSIAPPGLEYTHDTSAFLDYGVRVLDLERFDAATELGVSVRAARLYTGVTVPAGLGPVRGLTNATIDFRERLLRVVGGDAYASGGTLGGGAFFGGVQVARARDLDPYYVSGPSLDHRDTVLGPSTLEVYVNGQLTHREQVAPGPLDIRNIPATTGAGDTRIVLRDALGHEHVVTDDYYRPEGLLAPGEQEYSYTAGFQRENVGLESWDYGALAGMGTHRLGLTPTLTAGARLEGAVDRFSGGLDAEMGAGVHGGEIELAGAGSAGAGFGGAAGSFAWSFHSTRIGTAAWARFMSARYTTLGLDADADRAIAEAGVTMSVPVASWATSSVSYATAAMRDTGLNQRASLSAGFTLPGHLQLGVMASWSSPRAGEDDYDAWLGLTSVFAKRMTATLRGEAGDDGINARAEVQRTLPAGTGVGFRAGGQMGDQDEAYAYLDGQAPFGRADASYDWTPTGASSELGVSGGVVALGGKVFASRSIDGGYALVRVPGVKGVRATLDNNAVGRTDRNGDLVVTGLLPYYGNRIGIDDLDVPLDHAITSVERVIAPPVRGGAVVTFPVHPLRLVRGTLAVAGAAYGELQVTVNGAPLSSPVGSGGEFELADLPEGHWLADVRYAGGGCPVPLDVPAGDAAVLDLGTLRCAPGAAP